MGSEVGLWPKSRNTSLCVRGLYNQFKRRRSGPTGANRSTAVLQAQLAELFEHYPGLQVLTMDALYAERGLCQAIVSYGRDYLVRIKGNQPTNLEALQEGFPEGELGEPQAQTVEKKRVASRVGGCGSAPS